MVNCLERGADDLHMVQPGATAIQSSHFIDIQIGLTFLFLACPGCPGKGAVEWYVSVCLIKIPAKDSVYSTEFIAEPLRDFTEYI